MENLNKQELRTFVVSAIGGALEFYDFVIYVFFAGIISKLFFDVSSEVAGLLLAFNVYASGYFARVIGGLFFSHFGDRNGRKNSFAASILLMAIPTFLIGLLPTYQMIGVTATILLIMCRIAQGLAVGGELPCSITFVFEHAKPGTKAFACGILFCGVNLGVFLGSAVGALTTRWLSHDALYQWGWRIPFLLGGLLGIVGIYLRKKLRESPVFKQMNQEALTNFIPFKEVIAFFKLNIIRSMFTCLVTAVMIALVYLYLPVYLQTYYHFNANLTLIVNGIFVFSFAMLIIPMAMLCDRIGDRTVFLVSSLGLALFSIPLFYFFNENDLWSVIIAYTVISAFAPGVVSSSIVLLARSFPTRVRYSGAALSYNLAFGLLGGFTPLICTLLIKNTNIKYSPAFYLSLIAGLGILANIKKPNEIDETT